MPLLRSAWSPRKSLTPQFLAWTSRYSCMLSHMRMHMQCIDLANELFHPTVNPFISVTSSIEEHGLFWPGKYLLGREVSAFLNPGSWYACFCRSYSQEPHTLSSSLMCSVYRKSCHHQELTKVDFLRYHPIALIRLLQILVGYVYNHWRS